MMRGIVMQDRPVDDINITESQKAGVIQFIKSNMRTEDVAKKPFRDKVSEFMQREFLFTKSDKQIKRYVAEAVSDIGRERAENIEKYQVDFILDEYLDFERADVLNTTLVNVNPNHIYLLRKAVGSYHYSIRNINQFKFPKSPTYRWAKWTSYFLDSITPNLKIPSMAGLYHLTPNQQMPITYRLMDSVDIWTVGQMIASRDLIRTADPNHSLEDIEAWLNYQPFSGVGEDRYISDVLAKRIPKLKTLREINMIAPLPAEEYDSEDLNSLERLGVPLIADLYMNICGLEGLEDYAKVWLLPSQQREIWLDYARANPDTMNPFINLSDPETGDFIQFEI